jgi:hypothetical protein
MIQFHAGVFATHDLRLGMIGNQSKINDGSSVSVDEANLDVHVDTLRVCFATHKHGRFRISQ